MVIFQLKNRRRKSRIDSRCCCHWCHYWFIWDIRHTWKRVSLHYYARTWGHIRAKRTCTWTNILMTLTRKCLLFRASAPKRPFICLKSICRVYWMQQQNRSTSSGHSIDIMKIPRSTIKCSQQQEAGHKNQQSPTEYHILLCHASTYTRHHDPLLSGHWLQCRAAGNAKTNEQYIATVCRKLTYYAVQSDTWMNISSDLSISSTRQLGSMDGPLPFGQRFFKLSVPFTLMDLWVL